MTPRIAFQQASPGFWPTAGALALIYVALVAFPAWPVQGQEPETTNITTSPKEARHE